MKFHLRPEKFDGDVRLRWVYARTFTVLTYVLGTAPSTGAYLLLVLENHIGIFLCFFWLFFVLNENKVGEISNKRDRRAVEKI